MNRKSKIKTSKGLTLIETVINIFVYTVLILTCMAVAISYLRIRIQIRQTQQAVEELSLVMNQMTKEIRMSRCQVGLSCVSDGNIFIRTNNGTDVTYSINSDNELEKNGALFMENINGEFTSVYDPADHITIPLISIELWKLDKAGNEISQARVRTSISLRSGYQATTDADPGSCTPIRHCLSYNTTDCTCSVCNNPFSWCNSSNQCLNDTDWLSGHACSCGFQCQNSQCVSGHCN